MTIDKQWTDSAYQERPKRRGFRSGQGFGQAIQTVDNELRGGEHDLSQVRVSDKIMDRARENLRVGWRTQYQPEYADFAMELLTMEKQCWTLKAVSHIIGCEEKTMFKWIVDHPEFAQAIALGRSIQEVHFGSILLQGFKYSKSVEYVLANLHDWTAKREDTHKIIDLNREIAEREEFAQSHRVRKKVNWREDKENIVDAQVVETPPQAQVPKISQPMSPEEIAKALASGRSPV